MATGPPVRPGTGAVTGAVTATAAVPAANRAERREGDPPPPAPAPRVYGTPISPQEVDAPLPTRTPRQRPIGAAVYSDLLSPDPPPASPGPAAPAATTGAPATPARPDGQAGPGTSAAPATAPAGPWGSPPAPPGPAAGQASDPADPQGALASPGAAAPAAPAEQAHPPRPADTRAAPAVQPDGATAVGGAPATVPSWPPPAPTDSATPQPTRPASLETGEPLGWSGMWASPAPPAEAAPPAPAAAGPGEAPPAGEDPSRTGLPFGVIAAALLGAALIVGLALSIPMLLQNLRGDPPAYAVGKCVVREGDVARLADCSEPDAFEIVVQVQAIEDCPRYPDQHAITVDETGDVFCLEPAEEADEPPVTVTPPVEATK